MEQEFTCFASDNGAYSYVVYASGLKGELSVADLKLVAVDALAYLISGDEAVVNDIILTELVPFMSVRGEHDCINALTALHSPKLDIDWNGLRALQETCLRAGVNKVGIPDLIIVQQAIALDMPIFSLDRHFPLIAGCTALQLWPPAVRTKRKAKTIKGEDK